ncbi:enoyl-CoA hydratase/enoyl-CoA hydratase [Blastococcus colisei]|uniref:Enoyl-CoA hydratase/enoyl-CoA hydratase n=1 Tax=Blastococcus colisei TaxID=1564162 RepID=A0A543PG60_9ACTN|nr:enoyl-CoA hydratase/isomerase family protein [Blastococcus colisei]TQN43072.1 enoyl-CoA hydratase/enoyl-CoA hydratase [Blastococcus colisei]
MNSLPELQTLHLEIEEDTLTAMINRPRRANAVNRQLLRDLISMADWLRDRSDVGYLVLAHQGDVFSAGADLQELHDELSDEENRRSKMRSLQHLAQEMMVKLEGLEQISFAAMSGSAYGAGLAIAMTSDFRVMAENAVANLPESRLGMFLTYGATPRLVGTVGLSRAKEMIMFAEDVSAQDCLEWGIAQRVVPRDEVLPAVRDMIARLRINDRTAIRIAKQMANASAAVAFGDMVRAEPQLVGSTLGDGSVLTHLSAFLNRTP